jgi:exodeoxyribonuclease V
MNNATTTTNTSATFELSTQQSAALDTIANWFHNDSRQVFLLEGPAGSGKTTLSRNIGTLLGGVSVIYAAYTGKAASVMRAKGCTGADTIHSLIYWPTIECGCVAKPKPCERPPCAERCPHLREKVVGYELNPRSAVADTDLIVIDEVSMVGAELGRDLVSFGTKILVIGDRNQLPPIEGGGYFTSGEPDYSLTEIHRQAAGSPVINLATMARLGVELQIKDYGASKVVPLHRVTDADWLRVDQVICGKNDTRNAMNASIRKALGFGADIPQPGEKVVCLKNCKQKGLLNGTIWQVITAAPDGRGFYDITLHGDNDRAVQVVAPVAGFGSAGNAASLPYQPFDYGYVLTAHKSQGSQWDSVTVIDQSNLWKRDNTHTNWLYTAITRAAERVTVIV